MFGMEPTASPIQEKVAARMIEALEEFGTETERMRPEATLEELDVDSLDLFELGQILHQEFGIEVDATDFEGIVTLGDAQRAIFAYLQ